MKTKTIFNRLALAMMMPAMLLTTACSSDDDAVVNPENNDTKSTVIPLTVNVTREGDTTTRATYNESTKKLGFSTGDQLFVSGLYGDDDVDRQFAGTLNYVDGSDGIFTGDLTVAGSFSGTATELLDDGAYYAEATLLPAGYGDYKFWNIENSGESNAYAYYDATKAFATSTAQKTAKALAVEQFSYEVADDYDKDTHSFALAPVFAILNFTIVGLTGTDLAVSLTDGGNTISGSVTPDASGTVTFAMGVKSGYNLSELTLTVGNTAIALGSKELEAGHIYNIGRNLILANASTEDIGKLIGADGKIYEDADAVSAAHTTAVAVITFVGEATGESAPYNHGLALALSDANDNITCKWKTSQTDASHAKQTDSNNFTSESGLQYNATHNSDTYPAFKAAIENNGKAKPTGCSAWFLPSAYQWNQMITDAGGVVNLRNIASMTNGWYWSSTEYSESYAWRCAFVSGGDWGFHGKNNTSHVRAAIAF